MSMTTLLHNTPLGLWALWYSFTAVVQVCVSAGQTCDCSAHGNCNLPRLCYPGSQRCNRENVALGRPTNMSSSDASPCFAVDGDITLSTNGLCTFAESKVGDYNAWWYVDLGQKYTITDITIYRRVTWETRMADVHVKVDGQLCYKFPTHTEWSKLKSLLFPVNIQCDPPLTGRVVSLQKVITDRNDNYQTHLISICEVQVWACGHCRHNYCDKTSGACPQESCSDGWAPPLCRACAAGYYGERCTACGNCSDSTTCDSTTGRCPGVCKAGWQGERCLQPCEDGTYGPDCATQCGQCARGSTCKKTHGDCPAGCQEGWNGTQCDQNIRERDASLNVPTSTAVGPVVGAIVGVVVIGVIIAVPVTICVIRYSRRRSASTQRSLPQDACLSTHSPDKNLAAPTDVNPSAPQDLESAYENVGERSITYDSLQPKDQRSTKESVYTNPVFRADGGQADTVCNGNTDHEVRLKLEGTGQDEDYYNL